MVASEYTSGVYCKLGLSYHLLRNFLWNKRTSFPSDNVKHFIFIMFNHGCVYGGQYVHVRWAQINPRLELQAVVNCLTSMPFLYFSQTKFHMDLSVVTTAQHWFPVTTTWPYTTPALMLVCVGTKTVWLSSGQNCQTSWCQRTSAKHTNVYLLLALPTALNYFPESPHHFLYHIYY